MRYVKYPFVLSMLIVALVMSACATVPVDTLEKRVALFEVSYGEVLKTIQLYKKENRFSDATWKEIQNTVRQVSAARTVMKTSLEIGDIETTSNTLALASQLLTSLRSYYVTTEEVK